MYEAQYATNSFILDASGPAPLTPSVEQVCRGPFRGLCRRAGGGVEEGRRKTNQRLLMSTPVLDPSLPAARNGIPPQPPH